MKNIKRIFQIFFIITAFQISSCTDDKTNDDNSGGDNSGGGSPTGIWQRYSSPNGYNTDLAIGNIPGEPSNRVYMCEHPGSPSAGLYKGHINGNTITWDATHGLPNADFSEVNGERRLYFGVGAVEDAGKYRKGVWTNTCGELRKPTTQIYYRWTTDSSCSFPSYYSIIYKNPTMPSNPAKNTYYGPITLPQTLPNYANFFIDVKNNNSNTTTEYQLYLAPPADGYKRYYTHKSMTYSADVNRCLFTFFDSYLTYVDQPL